jgi:long-chain acyl-CoA synthetase
MNFPEFVARNAEWYPEKTAVIFEDRRLSWKQVNARANRVANHLLSTGVSKGDRVAIVSPNCIEYPEIMFGILKAGAVIVPISTMLQSETVLQELKDAGVKAVFAAHSRLPLVSGFQESCARIILEGIEDGWTEYQAILSDRTDAEPSITLLPEDLYNIVYSSGTTGAPKGIVHTHQARLLFSLTCGLEFRVHNEAISLISTPMYTNGTQLLYLPTVVLGGTLALMRSFDPAALLEIVGRERCSHAFLVPTQFIRIMEHPQFGNYDTSSMEILLSAAAPLARKTKLEILTKFPRSKLVELYGLTEGISTVLRPDEQMKKIGSVGKPRLGGDIKIIDDAGVELSRGRTGEIVGTNISMMTGYYGAPEKTREALWRDGRGRLYIRTGDIGRLDEDGYLYIIDRKKDLIISGGINIFPSDIEAVLVQHPEVAEAAVIGTPQAEWGEVPVAVVVKKNLECGISKEKLKEWTNKQLASYQRLAGLEFCSSLPRNDLGKVLKPELKKWFGAVARAGSDPFRS